MYFNCVLCRSAPTVYNSKIQCRVDVHSNFSTGAVQIFFFLIIFIEPFPRIELIYYALPTPVHGIQQSRRVGVGSG